MTSQESTDDFDGLQTRAADAICRDDVDSVYVGLITEEGTKEYYFGNTVDESELRRVAAEQLGMMTRVLAAKSASTPEEITELALQRAGSMNVQP